MSASTSDRPLMLRARPDVAAAAVRVQGSPRWVITDPLTLAHYDLSDQEYTLLSALRDGASLRDLQRAFEQRFAPRRITIEEVWQHVRHLHRAGLAVATGAGQGAQLHQRQAKQRREQAAWAWTRLLAIKLPGVNPDRLLDACYPLVRFAYTWPALLLAMMVMLLAGSMVLTDFSAFVAGMPALTELATPGGLAALAVTAVAVKVLHELAHALTCRHFGGRVHEMGVLLLAFAPAMYCDVSDMWRLPSKAKRMAVSAAGILLELFLAAIAALAWRYSEPGVAQLAALNVMIVCTVGTLMVNANPLLRYDGYYLLSDLTETPNLWQRSREAVGALVSRWLLRSDRPRAHAGPRWLALYGIASQLYMVVVLTSILWVLALTLRPYRLEALAYLAGGVTLAGVIAAPVRRFTHWARNPLSTRRTRWGRGSLGLAVGLALAIAVLCIPVRFRAEGDAHVALADAEAVVATVEGRLIEALPAGERVEQGQVIARLENPGVASELLELRGALAAAELRVEQLTALRTYDQQSSDELPAAVTTAAELRRQAAALEQEANRLTLRAPRDGVVIRPESHNPPPQQLSLAAWSGAPLDQENLGAWLKTGAEVCRVGEPQQVVAHVALAEQDIERLEVGQRVTLAWRQTPGVVTRGEVEEISQRLLRDSSPASQHGGAPPRYFARVTQLDPPPQLLLGGEGTARIDTGRTTLGGLIATRVRQWFRLP